MRQSSRALHVTWLVAVLLLNSGCGDTEPKAPGAGPDNAEAERGPEGTYVIDAQDLAEQMYALDLKRLKSPFGLPGAGTGRHSAWDTWDEAQRREAAEITRANVDWVWRDGHRSELRLEPGGRYTWITKERQDATPPEARLAPPVMEEVVEESAPGVVDLDAPPPAAPLPTPPPAEFTVEESRTAGRWKLEAMTLTLWIEEDDGRQVPPEKVSPLKMVLEDGLILHDTGMVVLRYRRTPK